MAATIAEGQPCGMMLLRLPMAWCMFRCSLMRPMLLVQMVALVSFPHADGPLRTLLARLRLDHRDVGQALAETLARRAATSHGCCRAHTARQS